MGELILKQAEEKGWGHTKEMLVVSEKMILMHTEISELVEALGKKPLRPKDTIEAECAGILLRTLHLGRAWGVDFDEDMAYKSRFVKAREYPTDADYLYLHTLISKGYDNYRHKKLKVYKRFLYRLAREVVKMTELMEIDLEKTVLGNIEINKARTWSAKKLNGSYQK